MNKKTPIKAEPAKLVSVRMSCVYSGATESWGIGSIVEVSTAEAARLVGLGVAEIVG